MVSGLLHSHSIHSFSLFQPHWHDWALHTGRHWANTSLWTFFVFPPACRLHTRLPSEGKVFDSFALEMTACRISSDFWRWRFPPLFPSVFLLFTSCDLPWPVSSYRIILLSAWGVWLCSQRSLNGPLFPASSHRGRASWQPGGGGRTLSFWLSSSACGACPWQQNIPIRGSTIYRRVSRQRFQHVPLFPYKNIEWINYQKMSNPPSMKRLLYFAHL